jgi:hypothetical protein
MCLRLSQLGAKEAQQQQQQQVHNKEHCWGLLGLSCWALGCLLPLPLLLPAKKE